MKTNSEAATIWRGIEKKDVLYLNVCVVFYLKKVKEFRRLYPQITSLCFPSILSGLFIGMFTSVYGENR